MSDIHSKHNVAASLFWKLLEKGGTQGIQFIVQIVLARLLTPQEFGVVAIVVVFINLAQTFIDGGFSVALIQKKGATRLDFSSIFYLSLVIATLMYVLIFMMSPFIADFYQNQQLKMLLRALGLILFPGVLNSIQIAYVTKTMNFKLLFKTSFIASILSGIIGITVAYLAYGVWALVFQQIAFSVINSIGLWLTVKWRPMMRFSSKSVKELFSYGSKILFASLVYNVYLDIRTLIIGKSYTAAGLAFYQRGEQIPKVIIANVDGSLQSVILPTLSEYQDNPPMMKSIVKRTLSISSLFIFPMMVGLIVIAEPLVLVLLKEKWLPAVPYLQIFCVMYAIWPFITLNLQPIKASGKSDLLLVLEVIKRVIGLIIIIVSIPFGIYGIAVGALIERLIEVVINAYPNKKLIDYGLVDQLTDVLPAALQSILMGGVIYSLKDISTQPLYQMLIQMVVGILVYLILLYSFKNSAFLYVLEMVKTLYNSKVKSKQ